jgi:DNA repair protein RadC
MKLKKGSAAAKAFMAKIRAAKGKKKPAAKAKKVGVIKSIGFENSNLYLNGFGIDSNGNKVVKISYPNSRAFSIQTNGVLKETNNLFTKNINELSQKELNVIENEVINYINSYGSKEQKNKLRTYKKVGAVKKVVNGWKKGNTNILEVGEKKYIDKKNVRVNRFDNGTFANFTTLSGYKQTPEIILGKVGALTLLKSLAPEVKLRITRGKKVATNKITSAKDISAILKKFITASKVQTQEYALAMFLNNNSNVLAIYQFGMGGFTSTIMDKRLLMAAALKLGATAIILAHNHPSGKLDPSKADRDITKDIIQIANLHQISVLDHVILTKDGYYSFAENGLI